MRYHLASKALRAFSATATTRRAYRKFGNLKRDYLTIPAEDPACTVVQIVLRCPLA